MLVEKIKNIYDPKEKKSIELVNNIINDDTDKYIMKHKKIHKLLKRLKKL